MRRRSNCWERTPSARTRQTSSRKQAVAIRAELTASDLAHTIHAHPTLAEAWMEAAHVLMGEPIHSAPPRKAAQ